MTRILFIDVRNSARSVIAEAWFNQLAPDSMRAFSCGTMPRNHADPLTARAMKEIGVSLRYHTPTIVNQQALADADMVILMGQDVFPGAFAPRAIWNFRDPTGESLGRYRDLRDAIRISVAALVAELRPAIAPNLASNIRQAASNPGAE